MKKSESGINPLLKLDYPDPDVIRVGDTYYMITTMVHFMPGGEILRSYDLVNWEHAAFVYDRLDSTPEQRRGRRTSTARACGRHPCGITTICFMCAFLQMTRAKPICTHRNR